MTVAEALATILAGAAEEAGLPGRSDGGHTTWSVGQEPIVILAADRVEFRLDPVLAAAARRTPDAGTSPRGDPWVTFQPRAIDQFAEDRLRAWFGAAVRRAGGVTPRT